MGIFGARLGIAEGRLYATVEEMAQAECALPEEDRVQVVVIVTPTPNHTDAIRAFVSRGFAVVCDKPLCSDMMEADTIVRAVKEARTPFMMISNYSGYPMVKQAKHVVQKGLIGEISKVTVEYEDNWLCALQLLLDISNLSVVSVCADLQKHVSGPRTPEDANILLRLSNGARGVIVLTQASTGLGIGLRLRAYGTKGSLLWEHEHESQLQLMPAGGPTQILTRGSEGLIKEAQLPPKIPINQTAKGFTEAYANLYASFHRRLSGGPIDYPTEDTGRMGIAFVEACMKSNEEGTWVTLAS